MLTAVELQNLSEEINDTRYSFNIPEQSTLRTLFQITEVAGACRADVWPGNNRAAGNVHCILRRRVNRRTG